MRVFVHIGLIALALAIGVQLYRLYTQQGDLAERLSVLESDVSALASENEALSGDVEYFSDEHNIAKEFKSLFNFVIPGEELYIIVPSSN
ncbi:MAG: hypothetical protein COU07_01115 [Candidatus Harrisonbacteria bacterium CG10_big_fil_rev_8_21_14_0_10_40_38]|uniref:Septum formation initiator n=1 Tax=Candidatus Harrisonbacteria bacterium CG10_big_fil_rev_8_21_14_0_10_40_38 TaxID=1974583 RepID=A0A2H0USX8_9BACT|nr:MAG: hypothetical protein COU07_01115 [Candidatus Harrisonbacteria bacterium CG10_big_fil_rev_8_21_14_0_10_40_38]